jgi:hypothetical protein
VNQNVITLSRVTSFINGNFDLRSQINMEPIFVGKNIENVSLTAIDGNQRIMAQYLTFGSLDGVPAYIYLHRDFNNWYFIPPLAR